MVAEIDTEQPRPVQITQITVGPEHIDLYSHVNYTAFPKLFEAGQDDYMNSRGIGFDAIERERGLRSFVRAMNVNYIGPLLNGDDPTISTSIGRVGNSSFTFMQELHLNDQLIADLELAVIMVDEEGRSTPIPADIKEKLLQQLEPPTREENS